MFGRHHSELPVFHVVKWNFKSGPLRKTNARLELHFRLSSSPVDLNPNIFTRSEHVHHHTLFVPLWACWMITFESSGIVFEKTVIKIFFAHFDRRHIICSDWLLVNPWTWINTGNFIYGCHSILALKSIAKALYWIWTLLTSSSKSFSETL